MTVPLLLALVLGQSPERIGRVELFGTGGRDAAVVEAALREIEGRAAPDSEAAQKALIDQVSAIVAERAGAPPTDVEAVCCDERGRWTIYVGLAWGGVAPPQYRAVPRGSASLPPAVVGAYARVMSAMEDAVRANAVEDHSRGYALSSRPTLRRAQLSLRQQAIAATSDAYRVLDDSADARQRAMAAFVLGYATTSRRQIDALTRATADPDGDTRNNAVRALWVIAQSRQSLAASIPPDPFLSLVTSGRWSDRNKGLLLVTALSRRRDPVLLDRLRRGAFAALVEMARWRLRGHADPARLLLGRIAGIPDARLHRLIETGDVDAIVNAAR